MVSKKNYNRIRVVLTEQDRTTVSRWCTNSMQPPIETWVEVAEILDVDIRELLLPTNRVGRDYKIFCVSAIS